MMAGQCTYRMTNDHYMHLRKKMQGKSRDIYLLIIFDVQVWPQTASKLKLKNPISQQPEVGEPSNFG